MENINKIIKDAMSDDIGAQRQIDFVWYSNESWKNYAFSFIVKGEIHYVDNLNRY